MSDDRDVLDHLRGFEGAYPKDIFVPLTIEQRKQLHQDEPGLQDCIAADMARHLIRVAITPAADEIERLRERIEELEGASVKEVLEFGVEQMSRGHDKYYIFDNEMINAAWIATRGSESGRGILRIFHIHECEGCVKGRVWISDGQDGDVEFDHAACNGHGWVIGGTDGMDND